MRKLLLLMFALLTGVSGAWADGTWNITSADYTTDGWTLMENNVPSGVTDLGNYTRYYRTEEITLTTAASLEVRFKYTSGDHRLDILGVDILDGSSNVVASDYHVGYTGGAMDKNTYLLNAIDAGTYTIRYIVRGYATDSKGNITINTIKYADSFANISQWYIIRIHANQAHYMYYDSSNTTTGISFTSSTADINNNNYLWGFVKNGSGVSIYNKAAGESLAIDNATPSTMSTDGTSIAFTLGTVAAGNYGWDADAFFSVYKTAGTYLNYQGGNLQRWNKADAGSNFMIYAVDAPTNLTATLTDVNGATYTVNYEGIAGMTIPTLTGCDGYTLTNGSWSGTNYSATITFPFPVSSNSVTNYTYIGSFHNKNYYSSEDFLWHSNGTNVIVHDGDVPNNTKSETRYTENEKYEWAITPTITTAGAISFTIKNASSGTYIYSTTTNNSHSGAVSLNATATPVTYNNTTTTGTCSPIHAFYLSSTKKYLSVNSVTGDANSQLGAYGTVHDGISVGFYTPADFATLEENLISACNAYNTFKSTRTFGTALGQYNGNTYDDMETAYATATTTSTYTAAQLTSLISTLENPASKLTLNLPTTGGFYKIMGYATKKYAKAGTAGSMIPNSTGETSDGTDIWYYNTDNTLINFSNGLGTISTHTVASATQTRETTTFGESTCSASGAKKIGVYEIKSNYSSGSQVWYSNTNNVDRNSANNHVNCEWVVTKVTSLPVTISKYGMRTFSAPVALTIPEGVQAFTVAVSGSDVVLTEVTPTIPANTPVVLYSHGVVWENDVVTGSDETFNFTIASANTDEPLTCELTPIIATRAKTDNDLTLQYDLTNKVFGFWKATGANIKGFSAYLEWNDSYGAVRSFVISMPYTTGIEMVSENPLAGRNIYDVQGRQVNKATKGLYIVNGKKVLF